MFETSSADPTQPSLSSPDSHAKSWDIPLTVDYACTSEDVGGAVVLRLVGDMGMKQATEIERSLTPTAARHPTLVVLDLSGVTFIASLAIGTLMAFQRGVVSRGGRVYYAAPSKVVADVIRHAHLDKVMKIAGSVEEALQAAGEA